jgi:hypothetical protein
MHGNIQFFFVEKDNGNVVNSVTCIGEESAWIF